MQQAIIYSVEPKPENIKLWRENVKNGRANLYEGVISNNNGVADLCCSNDKYMGASSIRRPTKLLIDKFKGLTFTHWIKVQSITLDTFISGGYGEKIDLLWIDTQGAEKNIIESGKETLERTKYLFIEYSLVENYEGQVLVEDMIKMLPDFELVGRFQENLFMKRR